MTPSEGRGAADAARQILVVFGTPHLYGLERAVIELFDSVRPGVEPEFLVSRQAAEQDLPVIGELRRRRLRHSLLSDRTSWPLVGRPRSITHLAAMLRGLALANLDALRISMGKDLLYVPNVYALLYSILACVLFRIRGKRVVYAFHDLAVAHPLLLRVANAIVSDYVYHSRLSARWLQEQFPYLSSKPGSIIPYVIETHGSGGAGGTALDGRRRHIVFAGQVAPHKGPDLLLGAFICLAPQYPDVDLHIIGGPAEAAFLDALRCTRNTAGLQGRVHFWGYREDLHDVLRQAYVYAQPSPPSLFHEAFGRGVVEAMGLGVPVIVFRSGALQEIVRDGETGLICKDETAGALAQALERFMDDPGFRDRCARNAMDEYRLTYAPDRVAAQWREFFSNGKSAE